MQVFVQGGMGGVGCSFVNREYRHAGLCAGGTWVCCGRNEVHMYA